MTADETVFPPSLGQPGSEVTYYPSPLTPKLAAAAAAAAACHTREVSYIDQSQISFTVDVPPASLPHIFAHRQWRAGMILADLIASSCAPEHAYTQGLIKGKKVLELGCGTALPALVAAHPRLGQAAFTLATDYNEPGLIRALKLNVSRNAMVATTAEPGSIKAEGYTWGTSPDDIFDLFPRSVLNPRVESATAQRRGVPSSSAPSFDTILLADTLWDPLSHSDLAKSLSQTLARTREARVVVVAGLHTGRERISEFVHKAARVGLQVCPFDGLSEQTLDSSAAEPTSKSLWDELDLVKEEELEARLASRTHDDSQSEQWTQHVLEFELAREEHENDEDEDDDHEQTKQTSTTSSSTHNAASPTRIESRGPRLTGKRRRFVSREAWRPEEAKERGGIKLRNRWMTVWTLRWSASALNPSLA